MELEAPAEYHDLESPDGVYHSVSTLAVIALLLGLLSPLAFAHELIWTIPIAGVALSGVAIGRIDRSEGVLIGRKAAIVGLALSLLCGLGAMTQAATRRLWLAHRADRVAERFLDFLRDGKTHEAHQLWTRPQFRMQPKPDYETAYAENPEATKEYEAFVKREVIKDIVSLGQVAQIEHQKTRLTGTDQFHEYLMVFYHLSGAMADGPIDKDIKFVIERTHEEDRDEQWRVLSDEVLVE